MKKLQFIKSPELFQGDKFLKRNKNYFEGYYFKNTNNNNGISFIPGISITKEHKKAFIQIITNNNSYNKDFNIEEFEFSKSPFYIKIGDNYFSKDNIHIDIKDDFFNIYGDVKYSNIQNINTDILNPNIMGPFTYIPFMECNHAILNMKSNINGIIQINNEIIDLNNGIGYIEKDWGISFPKSYIWIQGNNFKNSNVSFMLSIADIPFKLFSFKGLICSLIIDDIEYRFATYNNTKIKKYNIKKNILEIILQKGNYYLLIKSKLNRGHKLIAPFKGKMNKDIYESIDGVINITLKKDDKIIFCGKSTNCGLEIVS